MFKGLKNSLDETKTTFSLNLKEIIEQSKLMAFVVMGVSCLTVGYVMGSVTTSAMYKTLGNNKR